MSHECCGFLSGGFGECSLASLGYAVGNAKPAVRRQHPNSCGDSRLGCHRRAATPMWNGHSRPLPLTLTLILIPSQLLSFRPEPERQRRRSGGTCCPPVAPQLMWRQPPRLSPQRSDAPVEQTLLSVVFDVGFDVAPAFVLALVIPTAAGKRRRSGGTCCPLVAPQLMWRQPPRLFSAAIEPKHKFGRRLQLARASLPFGSWLAPLPLNLCNHRFTVAIT
jgi:hypothetical protein